jgi:phosphotransferase system enzyme I (PtsI)
VGHYHPAAPPILRLLRTVAAAGRRAGCTLSVCGEMAADPLLVALLVGLGFRAFSMTPAAIPVVKHSLATLDSRDARRIVRKALAAASADEVHMLLAPVAAAMHRSVVGDGPSTEQE